jgi:alanyl aminopeptidase
MLRLGDDKDLDAQARSMTLRWLETGKTTEPALSTDVVRAVSAKADKQLFDRLVHAAENWNDAAERLKALAGLARIDDPTLAPLIVKWAVNAKLPPVDRLRMLVLNSNENLASSMWKEVQQNYSGLTERLPKRFSLDPGTSVIEALEPLCTAEERRGVQAFFSERVSTLSGGPRALAQTLEKIDLCVARKAVHQPALAKYLSEQN